MPQRRRAGCPPTVCAVGRSGPRPQCRGAKSAVQMRDVAGMAGVSITTVSHIVNETRAVAPLTREKVLRAMRELKFHRNAYGRRLARGHSDSYGLIISDVEN